ncbi:MAG TPA: TetR/AcrR family transcriptional regulator [Treponemataceae bacterium]|nr:TetR/AcrR family transcriptional regulator [Treponemataceae bacterium]
MGTKTEPAMGNDLPDLDTPKGRIVAAALKLFAESGYHAVSVRDIAREVGIKDASIYSHFASKDEILETIIERFRVTFDSSIPDVAAFDDIFRVCAPRSFLQKGFSLFQERLKDKTMAQTYFVLIRERFDNPLAAKAWDAHRDKCVRYVADALLAMMRKGLIPERDAPLLARMYEYPHFLMMEDYVVGLCRGRDIAAIESEFRSHIDAFVDLVGK